MKPRLEVPADLAHLLEKREIEERRKSASAKQKPKTERRKRSRRKSSQ